MCPPTCTFVVVKVDVDFLSSRGPTYYLFDECTHTTWSQSIHYSSTRALCLRDLRVFRRLHVAAKRKISSTTIKKHLAWERVRFRGNPKLERNVTHTYTHTHVPLTEYDAVIQQKRQVKQYAYTPCVLYILKAINLHRHSFYDCMYPGYMPAGDSFVLSVCHFCQVFVKFIASGWTLSTKCVLSATTLLHASRLHESQYFSWFAEPLFRSVCTLIFSASVPNGLMLQSITLTFIQFGRFSSVRTRYVLLTFCLCLELQQSRWKSCLEFDASRRASLCTLHVDIQNVQTQCCSLVGECFRRVPARSQAWWKSKDFAQPQVLIVSRCCWENFDWHSIEISTIEGTQYMQRVTRSNLLFA